jgi:RNA polymerase sigma-54 factor
MLRQSLQQKLQQKLTPQQIQLMKLIQLPTLAFEQRLKEEIEENPALEEGKEENAEKMEMDNSSSEEFDDRGEVIDAQDINIDEYLSDDEVPEWKLRVNNYSADDDEKKVPYAQGESFTEYLKSQLASFQLDEKQKKIAEFLIGSINDNGYLRSDIIEIVDDLAFNQNIFTSEEEVEKILRMIQELDPPGVGARDLKESLIIQLKRKKNKPSRELAIKILEEAFDYFINKKYKKLQAKFNINEDQLKEAIDEIVKLNPKPGNAFNTRGSYVEHIIPDFIVNVEDGNIEVSLNSKNAPELHISPAYTEMLKAYKADKTKSQKEAVMFIKQKLDSAKWFIDAVNQRHETLLKTMNAIVDFQKEYFLTGDERKIKPMILKNIAERIGMDISTISRVASSKYVQTPYGVKLLKDLFSESMKNEQGEDVSTIRIKNVLKTIIDEENKRKPLTDEQLAKELKKRGFPIARRTIAKYREQLGIPVARLRKEI